MANLMYAAPLMRTQTAPVFQASTTTPPGGMNASNTTPARASQLSGTTAYSGSTTSLTSLSSAATAVPGAGAAGTGPGGPPVVTASIVNQRADASRSLYQICVSLKQRLALVPGFDAHLGSLDPLDPVESLWALLRTGHSLLTIYNATQPETPLVWDELDEKEDRRQKKAVFKFIQACLKELHMPSEECFVIKDLAGNDTTGFVKVTQVVNRVLDHAEAKGLLLQPAVSQDVSQSAVGAKMSKRDYVIRELVDTERKYVQDLENLHDLKKTLETRGIIPGDVIYKIFLNIDAILDFQRRFLIKIESLNSMPQEEQQWGLPFTQSEHQFEIYQPFIANQRKAANMAGSAFDGLMSANHPVAADLITLTGFLNKPMQRISKYPLLLRELVKTADDETIKSPLKAGFEAAERVLQKANESVNRDMLDEALEDLRARVDDWKNHKVEQFGKLLLHGVYGVMTGKSETEKDYEIYLFECILLCCKEMTPNKSKDKNKEKSKMPKDKVRNKNARLQLKGRIFMTNVTDVVSMSKPGSHSVQIWWKGDPGVENFTIKFSTEETMKKWATGLDQQRKSSVPPRSSVSPETSDQFPWIRAQNNMENPYAQQDDDDDDESYPVMSSFGPPSQSTGGTMTRNASSTSLRQRSMTNESSGSLATMVRAAPPRFPMSNQPTPLSLQTQQLPGATSPGPRGGGDSYFSPVAESPPSSRTSTTSGVFPTPTSSYSFPRGSTPSTGWEDNNRYTAPAMPRAPSRDGTSPGSQYGMNGRNPRGPSLPPMAANGSVSSSQSAAQLQRSRSYSTPDINGPPGVRRNTHGATGPGVPAVPGIPPHLNDGVPRSQTASPRTDLPVRSNTQSPSAQRERMHGHQHSGSFGGTMSQFPAAPLYSRQNPPSLTPQLSMDGSMRTSSPAMGTGSGPGNPLATPDLPMPTQLKVKVLCDSGNYVTLVVAFNITYQSLIDRIDAKLARFTQSSIGKGMLKLRYRDEDGDFVTIASDEDIQIAFSEWREGVRNMYSAGVGEIELFCGGDTGSG